MAQGGVDVGGIKHVHELASRFGGRCLSVEFCYGAERDQVDAAGKVAQQGNKLAGMAQFVVDVTYERILEGDDAIGGARVAAAGVDQFG